MIRTWLAIMFAMALLAARDARARTELLKTSPGSVVHWTRTEIRIAVDERQGSRSLPPESIAMAIEKAAAAWNRIPAGQPRLLRASADAADVLIRFCRERWTGETIDLGMTRFTASLRDGTVTSATVDVNECDHGFTVAHGTPATRFDLQSVLEHEFGHVLGLGHNDNPSAVMYPSGGGVPVRVPHLDDQTALALIYFGRQVNADASSRTSSTEAVASPVSDKANRSATQSATDTRLAASWLPTRSPDAPSRPENSVSLLQLTRDDGRQVTIYTCEPTILPPMADVTAADAAAKSTDGQHRRHAKH